jgi:hypothetical protein
VAEGAAVLGGILSGNKMDYLLLDTYPNSLSVPTTGGIAKRIIERNTTIPVRKSQIFSTSEHNQTRLDVGVYEGERQMVADNAFIGSVTLVGIPAAMKGIPQIEVAFDIDGNGILNVSARDVSTGRSATATISAPLRLPYQQVEVIKGIVEMEMKKVRERFAREVEQAVHEEKRKEALDCVGKVQSLLSESGEHLAGEQVATLRGGCDVVGDYLDRGAPAGDLHNLLTGLRREFDKVLGSNVARNARLIFEDTGLAPWAESAAASLNGHQSLSDSMADFAALYELQVNSIKTDLQRASNEADVCSNALAELHVMSGASARQCLGLVLSYYAGHVPLALNQIAPRSDSARDAEPLLILFLYTKLSGDKSTQRWVEAAGHFSSAQLLKFLIPMLGQVKHATAANDEELRACLRRVPSEDLYAYFRSLQPDERVAYLSHPGFRARLRDAFLEILPVTGPRDKKFILLSLTGMVDRASTQALLEALNAADDDDIRALIINLLPSLQDSRVLRPLLELIASASPSVRETAQSALYKCRSLMGEEWAKGLSAQEWYEYYSAAPPGLRNYWTSDTALRQRLRKILCQILPERSASEQMTILDTLDLKTNTESSSDYVNLLSRVGEVATCCRLIAMVSALRDRRAVVPLVGLLADERPEVRESASAALAGWRDLLDPEIERFIRITKQVLEHGWPPSLLDRMFLSGYVKRRGELKDFAEGLKRRRVAAQAPKPAPRRAL